MIRVVLIRHVWIMCLHTACALTGKNLLPVPVLFLFSFMELEISMRIHIDLLCECMHADSELLESIARYFAAQKNCDDQSNRCKDREGLPFNSPTGLRRTAIYYSPSLNVFVPLLYFCFAFFACIYFYFVIFFR